MLKRFYASHSKVFGFLFGTLLSLILVGGGVLAATSAWTSPIVSPPIAISASGTVTILPPPPIATVPNCTFTLITPTFSGSVQNGGIYTGYIQVNVTNTSKVGTDGLDPNFHSISIVSCTGLPAGWTYGGSYTSTTGCAPNTYVQFQITITSPVLNYADASSIPLNLVIQLSVD
jgi:hypothetical protein